MTLLLYTYTKEIHERKKMKREREINKSEDIEKIKQYLKNLGFICKSYPTAQNLIYSKNNEVIIIKNNM